MTGQELRGYGEKCRRGNGRDAAAEPGPAGEARDMDMPVKVVTQILEEGVQKSARTPADADADADAEAETPAKAVDVTVDTTAAESGGAAGADGAHAAQTPAEKLDRELFPPLDPVQPVESTTTAQIFDQDREKDEAEQNDDNAAMASGFIASATADAMIASARSRENWDLLRKAVKESIRREIAAERRKELLQEIAARPTSQPEAKNLDKEFETVNVDEEKVAKAVHEQIGNEGAETRGLDEAEWILKEMLRREAANMLEEKSVEVEADNENIPPRREAEAATFERNAEMEQVREETAAEEDAAARKIQGAVPVRSEEAELPREDSKPKSDSEVRFADNDAVVAEIPEDRA